MEKGSNNFNALALLNKKSQKQAEHERAAVEERRGNFEVVMLDVYDLVPSGNNFYSTKDIEELALSIELLGGIRQNLEVKPPVHGKYEVTAGHRRRLASLRLVEEGKEQFRYVPCVVKDDRTEIMKRLSLILTNSTARDMSDWEQVQQYKELKAVLEEYRKEIDQEAQDAKEGNGCPCGSCAYGVAGETCGNAEMPTGDKKKYYFDREPGCPYYEKVKLGRTREIIADLLHLSGTQLSRYEKIDNSLKEEFKEELRAGNINISTAHEIARRSGEEQERLHEEYQQIGELHIKDVKEEPKKEPQELPESQVKSVRAVIKEIMTGEVNRAVFKDTDMAAVVNTLKRFFYQSYKGGKVEPEGGEQVIYRFSNEGVYIMSKGFTEKYLVDYESLAGIITAMILAEELEEEPEPEIAGPMERRGGKEKIRAAEERLQEPLQGIQDNIMNHPEYLPGIESGLSFTEWLERKNGRGQQEIISGIIREQFVEISISSFEELERNIVAAVNDWLTVQNEAYAGYLKG
ncbi:MAG: ParB/RepB/Spo0J family partition protein [Lachnospiraceae bacterium]|nr:ParB/RepB/Spo0J family partition protein [Lachnospiraceae bacterium]MCM1240459.1 ParB/RepB/Spo0J family partition protein [Lachnospiraceae bacterium]